MLTPMSKKTHIFIATPCFGGNVSQTYMQSVFDCMAKAAQHNLSFTLSTLGSDALITRARNTLLHQFLTASDATHLLFIDSDIGFSIDDVIALLEADKDAIGGAYPLKAHYWDHNTERFLHTGEHPHTASLRYVGDCAALYDTSPPATLAPVSYVGTGFMLLKRTMLLDMIKAYPETRYTRIDAQYTHNPHGPQQHQNDAYALFDCLISSDNRTYLSEDFAFCHRWNTMGGTFWLHRGLALSHTGPATFQGAPLTRTLPLVTMP